MRKSLKEPVSMMYHRNQSNIPAASYGVFDLRGSRQMDMQACPLGSLPAGIKEQGQKARKYGGFKEYGAV
ncbi:MAG: hypothetical protein ACLRT5_01555 [Lachnospiraceae bacterium]